MLLIGGTSNAERQWGKINPAIRVFAAAVAATVNTTQSTLQEVVHPGSLNKECSESQVITSFQREISRTKASQRSPALKEEMVFNNLIWP